jgi:hypothetical protein
LLAIGVGVMAIQLLVGFPGSLSCESYCFLHHYGSGKPLLAAVFDPRSTDFGMYQGRELSYLFDWLDVQFIRLSIAWGQPHFLSITYLCFITATAILAWRFLTAELALPRGIATLLVWLYATTPTAVGWNSLGRSAKIGVTLCLAVAIPLACRMGAWPGPVRRPGFGRWFLFAATLVAMTLFDRQGVYLVAAMAMYLGLAWLFRRALVDAILFLLPLVVLFLNFLYVRVLAPWIVHAINGYWPDMQYLHVDAAYFMQQWGFYLASGVELFADASRFMYGNLPAAVMLVVIMVLLALQRSWRIALLAVAILLAMVLMDALMVMKHSPVLDSDMRRIYYWNPQTLVVLLMLPAVLCCTGVPQVLRHGSRLVRGFAAALLCVMLIGNICALPDHLSCAYGSYLHESRTSSRQTLAAIRDLRDGKPVHKAQLKWFPFLVMAD